MTHPIGWDRGLTREAGRALRRAGEHALAAEVDRAIAELDRVGRWRASEAETRAERDQWERIALALERGHTVVEQERDTARAELRDGGNDLLAIRGILSPNGQPRRVPDHVPMVPFAAPAVAWLADEVDRLGDRLAQVAAEYEVELATARRDAAADALEEAANDASVLLESGARAFTANGLRRRAEITRAGTRATPDSPQPADGGGQDG